MNLFSSTGYWNFSEIPLLILRIHISFAYNNFRHFLWGFYQIFMLLITQICFDKIYFYTSVEISLLTGVDILLNSLVSVCSLMIFLKTHYNTLKIIERWNTSNIQISNHLVSGEMAFGNSLRILKKKNKKTSLSMW